MSSTDEYYKRNAQQYIEETATVDMQALYQPFLDSLPANCHILDAGCGSGRDAFEFQKRGYQVSAFDPCETFAVHAGKLLGKSVPVMHFKEITGKQQYDGIWACASLLHVPEIELPSTFERLWSVLAPGGVLYCSFKRGKNERYEDGRHFTDADDERIKEWVKDLPGLAGMHYWYTSDRRVNRDEQWVNALIHKATKKLITGGGSDPLLPHLCAAINEAHVIEMGVAFVKTTGLRYLLPDLQDALQRVKHGLQPATVRILTSDYLDVTDPEALRLLMLLKENGAQVRVYESYGSSFHLKAYLFQGVDAEGASWGRAFIGSSNISRQALKQGLEWNYRISYPEDKGFLEAVFQFDKLFDHPRSRDLTDSWIDNYEARRIKPLQSVEAGSTEAEPPPTPTKIQNEALRALSSCRAEGYIRGLVVMATGLGKTWLAAFDAKQAGARKILFVAHREEILNQAAVTFSRINPSAHVGFYHGQKRDSEVDVLCASIQTLGKDQHLNRFDVKHFDYIVVDEFHHAAAPTYHRLLNYFHPRFMLGLTATPNRTDNANILSLCDDNLVYESSLFTGVKESFLVPFHYYGIFDDVDYKSIPWRSGRFDPDILVYKLATIGRARHALNVWRQYSQTKTLAFCASIKHAEYMADYFRKQGVSADAVYVGSYLSRGEALERLDSGQLEVLFSVDLFSEGVDVPSIDTVMMLRPTESKILFLQQLGRGLRKAESKEKLVVLDFVGNHQSFLYRPMALMGIDMDHKQLVDFANKAEQGQLKLPPGCYVNFDLQFIDFLKSLDQGSVQEDYQQQSIILGRRPTLTEFYHSGASIKDMRSQYGHWFSLVLSQEEEMPELERVIISKHGDFLRDLEKTPMTKSYKMVLLEAFNELDGWREAPSLERLSERSWHVLQRRRNLLVDLPDSYQSLTDMPSDWHSYWRKNPINAWANDRYFSVEEDLFIATLNIGQEEHLNFLSLVQELIDYRFATYESRVGVSSKGAVVSLDERKDKAELPYFPNLKIACGHFKSGRTDCEDYRSIGLDYGRVDRGKHFIARASGHSMDGGKNPIKDGDYLLLEVIGSESAGKISGDTVAIEKQDVAGDNQYLLRKIIKGDEGQYILRANNTDYDDIQVTPELHEQFRTFARLKAIIDPLHMQLGKHFMREEIPTLFGQVFNPGNWHSGHVVIKESRAHILLVTLNKQGRSEDRRYQDHWIDDRHFHWQSQAQTTPESRRGKELINHQAMGVNLHLFVRTNKLENGKAAPFQYCGRVKYLGHSGSKPMNVEFELVD